MSLPEPIMNLINNLLASEWFYIIVGVWFLVSLASKKDRNLMTDRLADIISKPIIFDEDKTPTSVPFYPRSTFERVAKALAVALVFIPQEINRKLSEWINAQYVFIVDKDKPWKVLGYAINLVLFLFFIWADAIAIANALDAMGLLAEAIWAPLTYYELAVAFGSFFAIVVAAIVAREIYSEKSDLSDWDEQEGAWKKAAKVLTVFLIVSGLLVVFALGMGRFQRLGLVSDDWSGTVTTLVNFTTLILVPVNTVVATLLIHHESIKGILLIFIMAEGVVSVIVKIWEYIALILGAMGPFTVDIIYRLMLGVVFVIIFFLLTPLDLLISLIPSKK